MSQSSVQEELSALDILKKIASFQRPDSPVTPIMECPRPENSIRSLVEELDHNRKTLKRGLGRQESLHREFETAVTKLKHAHMKQEEAREALEKATQEVNMALIDSEASRTNLLTSLE